MEMTGLNGPPELTVERWCSAGSSSIGRRRAGVGCDRVEVGYVDGCDGSL